MAGFIILDDGRACAPASWAYDGLISAIADELTRSDEEKQLAEWLRGQQCAVLGMGLGSVDVRELTPLNRRLFRDAAQRAFVKYKRLGPVGWHDPSFFPAWLERFHKLLRMWKSIDRGEPPGSVTDLTSPIPSRGGKAGPGWEKEESNHATELQ